MPKYESLSQAREEVDHCDRCEFCDGCKRPDSLCDDAVCDHCGEAFSGAEVSKVRDNDGEMLCEDCEANLGEAAHERSLSAFYGGDGPTTIAEQQEAARRLK